MGNTCPSIAKSQVQSVFVALEDVSGIQQPPLSADYILPSGRASMTQTPGFSDSEELSQSLNTTAQFQDAVPAGTGSISMYARLDGKYGRPQGHALFEALMGDFNDPTRISAVLEG